MRVLHLSTAYSTGGAGLGVTNLHNGLVEQGVDSHVAALTFPEKFEHNDGRVIHYRSVSSRLRRNLARRYTNYKKGAYPERDKTLFSLNHYGSGLHQLVKKLSPDIVHLHWINTHALSLANIAQFSQPVVWTLRDLWPFTGGCHYPIECRKFTRECGGCPILKSSRSNDLSHQNLELKSKLWKDVSLHPVGISEWISNQARQSSLFSGRQVRTIDNCIDSRYCESKIYSQEARLELLMKPKPIVKIGLGAINTFQDKRKGGALAIQALNQYAEQSNRRIELHLFGQDQIPDLHLHSQIKLVNHGYLREVDQMISFYQEVHLMLTLSAQEAFGKTVAEAMSQGTPVVAFDNSGPADIVRNNENGLLVPLDDQLQLLEAIDKGMDPDQWKALSDAASEARKVYHPSLAAERYSNLYEDLDY